MRGKNAAPPNLRQKFTQRFGFLLRLPAILGGPQPRRQCSGSSEFRSELQKTWSTRIGVPSPDLKRLILLGWSSALKSASKGVRAGSNPAEV